MESGFLKFYEMGKLIMSVSLYYTARRQQPLSGQERGACGEIVERYIAGYPLGELYESFCVYDADELTEGDVIFEGATKLPLDEGEEHFAGVLDYWMDCLQEIIDCLAGAQWDIHIDDADITSHFTYSE